MDPVAILVNAHSGVPRRTPGIVRNLERTLRRGDRLVVTNAIDEIDGALLRLRPTDASMFALCGGDGTYSVALSEIERRGELARMPPFALLSNGTANLVPRNLGLYRPPHQILKKLLAVRPVVRDLPTLKVNDDVGFIFGSALVARFFDAYYERGRQGLWESAKIVARVFAGSFVGSSFARRILTPMPARIRVDGVDLEPRAFSLIVAAVVKDLGLHMRVTYRANEQPGAIHFVASPLGPRRLGPQMPRVLAGRRLRGDGHFDDLVREVVVDFGPSGAYVLDGEIRRAERVTVRPGPNVRIACPAPVPSGPSDPR